MNEMDLNSRRTAITRTKISTPLRMLLEGREIELFPSYSVLDFGCGKGFDADTLGYRKYDKYHWDDPTALKPDHYSYVLCTYVLNTVSEETQKQILRQIHCVLNKSHGATFITVRRDIPREGTPSQRYVRLPLPKLLDRSNFATYYCHASQLGAYLESS